MKATELLKQQHREVKELFRKLEKMRDGNGRREIMASIADSLQGHMALEEEIFYPALREATQSKSGQEMIPEAYEEHHVVKLVLDELPDVDPRDERFEAKMTVLEELIEHHVEEEEKEMFKTAEKQLGSEELERLGNLMADELRLEAGDEDEEDDADDDEEDEDEGDEYELEDEEAEEDERGSGTRGRRR
ncbi:MAG: hemerythrin domain-containing protein [Candidatus Binatia bacterium]